MKLRDDWAERLWGNKLWVIRFLLVTTVLLPLFLIEKAVEVQSDFSNWLYWKWRDAEWIQSLTASLGAWVGKIEEVQSKERKVDE